MKSKNLLRLRESLAVLLILVLGTAVHAGITMTGADGITMTGADGITMTGADWITMTRADGVLAIETNGITMTGADAPSALSRTDGITMTGADGITMTGADGITMTGADGITMTGADGATYRAAAITVISANGITMTGADGITMTGADGITMTGADGITMTGADGITMTGADGITMTGADNFHVIGVDGVRFSVAPNGITMTGADGITMTGADGITMTGADGITMTGADSSTYRTRIGLQSLDPELAITLDRLADDSNVNVAVVFHRTVTDYDIAQLRAIGITGGTRYRQLPVVTINATRDQLIQVSRLSAVRSLYSNRTLRLNLDKSRSATGVERLRADNDLTSRNSGTPITGRGVTVAVLDTGIDSTHPDLAGKIAKNVKFADTQSAGAGFHAPARIEDQSNTDFANGHGTFVAGVIAGSGKQSAGEFGGIAGGTRILGLSAGDFSLFHVLAGFDYLLEHGATHKVRVVNCSFSSDTVFDTNDPVNVATRMLTDAGINVVFSAGNNGPGLHSLNPYAVAPWVTSVGSVDAGGKLANFSSRGSFGSDLFKPTLVAPGVKITSLRSSGASSLGAVGIASGGDAAQLRESELPYYTIASGTSFSAPLVAATIAMMLEANPQLQPSQVREILQRTATPLTPYYSHEVGAGMLNTHASVLDAAFPERRIGAWRAGIDKHGVRFLNEPLQRFSGSVYSSAPAGIELKVPENTVSFSTQIAWGPLWSLNDLSLALHDANGTRRAESNVINLPGLTGKRERILLHDPKPGAWNARVAHTVGSSKSVSLAQDFNLIAEVTRADYQGTQDIVSLAPQAQDDVRRALRTFSMSSYGKRFYPYLDVTRAGLARALLITTGIPHYVAGSRRFADAFDPMTAGIVESVQANPAESGGDLFPDAGGNTFRPYESATRLTAAVALVRAANLRAEAEQRADEPLPVIDLNGVSDEYLGYINVALKYGLLSAENGTFRPHASLTRIELARALTRLARQR